MKDPAVKNLIITHHNNIEFLTKTLKLRAVNADSEKRFCSK